MRKLDIHVSSASYLHGVIPSMSTGHAELNAILMHADSTPFRIVIDYVAHRYCFVFLSVRFFVVELACYYTFKGRETMTLGNEK